MIKPNLLLTCFPEDKLCDRKVLKSPYSSCCLEKIISIVSNCFSTDGCIISVYWLNLRFEETRQAIKDNVRMLEKMTESSSATNLGDEETSSSYPYSLNKKGRSISSTSEWDCSWLPLHLSLNTHSSFVVRIDS